VRAFLIILLGGMAAAYLFILVVDPFDIFPFSLPMERPIVSTSDRFMYPQIVRSRRFDSLVLGTSTSRLLDPNLLDQKFHAQFANLAMSSARAWEQMAMLDLFLRTIGPPKVVIIGLDTVWCDREADRDRITFRGFPDWLYDDHPWKGFPHLLNYATFEIAVRLVGWHLGLYPERIRYDGYEVFVPPESEYDPVRAHDMIWGGVPAPPAEPRSMPAAQRAQLRFPALPWLDAALARIPSGSLKILAFMPVNVAAQPMPGTIDVDIEAECKARIAAIGRDRDAKVIDWRIPSVLTRNDLNYWDRLHYRVPIATRIADQLAAAALTGQEATDGSYVFLVH